MIYEALYIKVLKYSWSSFECVRFDFSLVDRPRSEDVDKAMEAVLLMLPFQRRTHTRGRHCLRSYMHQVTYKEQQRALLYQQPRAELCLMSTTTSYAGYFAQNSPPLGFSYSGLMDQRCGVNTIWLCTFDPYSRKSICIISFMHLQLFMCLVTRGVMEANILWGRRRILQKESKERKHWGGLFKNFA